MSHESETQSGVTPAQNHGKHYRVVVKTKCNQTFVRVCTASDNSLPVILATSQDLHRVCERLLLAPESTTVQNVPRGPTELRPLKICNLVGKINHASTRQVFRNEVSPYVMKGVDSFGTSWSVHTIYGNVRVNACMTVSLFRGACSADNILQLVDQVFVPESILRTSVHMFVAMGHTAQTISDSNCSLKHAFCNCLHWKCVTDDVIEDVSMYRHFLLKDFDHEWVSSLGITNILKSIRVSIARSGFVSVFVSMPENEEIDVHSKCERVFDSLLHFLSSMIQQHT